MKRILAAALVVSVANAGTPMDQEEIEISPVGVVAYSVLSQIELAKIENFKIEKAIEVAKVVEKLEVAKAKLGKMNSETELLITPKSEDTQVSISIKKATSIAGKLSDSFSWAQGILSQAGQGIYASEYQTTMAELSGEIARSKRLRANIERLIALPQPQTVVDNSAELEAELERQKANREMLAAEASELRQLIEGKLLLGAFEHELYYVTADHKLTDDQEALVERIFGVLAEKEGLKIEITGRADPRGNRQYNEKLARSRADEVVGIAKRFGIKDEQISVKSSVTDVKIRKNREMHFFDRNTSLKVWIEK